MEELDHIILDKTLFQTQLLNFFKDKKHIIFLNRNDVEKMNFFAVSNSDDLYMQDNQFGFVSYDYKNQIEQLFSKNFDGIQFPEKHFFTPEILFKINNQSIRVLYSTSLYNKKDIEKILIKIQQVSFEKINASVIEVVQRISKEEYIQTVEVLKEHIQQGDIYEVNYCQEYFAENVKTDPIDIYLRLNEKSPTPFSCFVKYDEKYLMSSSPERFIQKCGRKIISQPIKGTIKRGKTKQEDENLKNILLNDKKERSENIMIVDLVRNDISKIAKCIKVDELCGIYTFPQVHQMISTVSGQINDNINFEKIIKSTFPMGSMTGAPKIRAMELIEKYEKTKRGLYSGTVGYINKTGDFDFNVIIRSILYNQENNYLSFIVGGAITSQSDPEKEYDECLLKAKAMIEVLGN